MPENKRRYRLFRGRTIGHRGVCLALGMGLTVLGATDPLGAQGQPDMATPAVLASLEGAWAGSGVLMKRSAEFRMEWELRPGGFVRLSFSNAWLTEEGESTPVLSSEATYLVRDSSAVGIWVNTRPQQLTLSSVLTDSTFVTGWTAAAEQGRTEYIVQSADQVVVRDFVLVEGEFRLFAEATYRRERAPTSVLPDRYRMFSR